MTLCFAIKNRDTGLLRYAIREICILFQFLVAKKPIYAKAMLRHIYIIDTKAANPIVQEAYLANALVNPQGFPQTFYKIDLLLEHQNREFKRFRVDREAFLQESNEIFCLYVLSIDILKKVRFSINRVVVGCQRAGRHLKKDFLFDILNLADQLHRSKSTDPNSPE